MRSITDRKTGYRRATREALTRFDEKHYDYQLREDTRNLYLSQAKSRLGDVFQQEGNLFPISTMLYSRNYQERMAEAKMIKKKSLTYGRHNGKLLGSHVN
jgi:hypothetical protein